MFPPDFLLFLHQFLQLDMPAERVLLVEAEDVSCTSGGFGSNSRRLGGVPRVDGEDVTLAILSQAVVTVLVGFAERPDELAFLSEELEPPKMCKNESIKQQLKTATNKTLLCISDHNLAVGQSQDIGGFVKLPVSLQWTGERSSSPGEDLDAVRHPGHDGHTTVSQDGHSSWSAHFEHVLLLDGQAENVALFLDEVEESGVRDGFSNRGVSGCVQSSRQ